MTKEEIIQRVCYRAVWFPGDPWCVCLENPGPDMVSPPETRKTSMFDGRRSNSRTFNLERFAQYVETTRVVK
ncbi:hypothetical protein DPMN_092655 [Dreissena polymorpha]|uniref:Uncharacterized protein n=1 Tax=Dreissena polymorpha TaxID=45954 RepID=A0A9D4L2Q1_DREPO|nr:hypothetical protein DPMN_092655 [Dreissena polymorpha]